MSDLYLFRGVSYEFYSRNNGELIPKKLNAPFIESAKWGEFKWGDGSTFGESPANAVITHQLNQKGFPTSGISTTPHRNRAEYYARGKSGKSKGCIYIIDCLKLAHHSIRQFVVKEFARWPSIPEDDEVILVAKDFGKLPLEICIKIECIL